MKYTTGRVSRTMCWEGEAIYCLWGTFHTIFEESLCYICVQQTEALQTHDSNKLKLLNARTSTDVNLHTRLILLTSELHNEDVNCELGTKNSNFANSMKRHNILEKRRPGRPCDQQFTHRYYSNVNMFRSPFATRKATNQSKLLHNTPIYHVCWYSAFNICCHYY